MFKTIQNKKNNKKIIMKKYKKLNLLSLNLYSFGNYNFFMLFMRHIL